MSDKSAAAGMPVRLSHHWVFASLDDISSKLLRMHLSITLGDELLVASDVSVAVEGGSGPLTLVDEPVQDAALPTVGSRGTAAFAQYDFNVAEKAGPFIATVTVQGESAKFLLSGAKDLVG